MRRLPVHVPVLAVCALVAGLLALAPAAFGETALEQYQRTGRIDPCTASGGGAIPNDVQQYAPDFKAALEEAQRHPCNRGGGSGSGSGSAGTTLGGGSGSGTGSGSGGSLPSSAKGLAPGTRYLPKPPAPTTPQPYHDARYVQHLPLPSGGSPSTPAPIVALAIMAILAALAGAVVVAGRRMGWDLDRLAPVRHAFAGAGARVGGAVGDVAGRLRRRS